MTTRDARENGISPEWPHQFLIDDLVFATGRSPDATNQCGGKVVWPVNSRDAGRRTRESGESGGRPFGGRRCRFPVADSDIGLAGGVGPAIFGDDVNRLPCVYRRGAENVARYPLRTRKTTGRRHLAAAKPGTFTFWKPAAADRPPVPVFGGALVFPGARGERSCDGGWSCRNHRMPGVVSTSRPRARNAEGGVRPGSFLSIVGGNAVSRRFPRIFRVLLTVAYTAQAPGTPTVRMVDDEPFPDGAPAVGDPSPPGRWNHVRITGRRISRNRCLAREKPR